nr:hypothetical protein [Roseibium denhamense]
MQEKRAELDAEKRKKLIERIVHALADTYPDLYYQSTSQIALLIKQQVDDGTGLSNEDRALLQGLSQRDIEVLLSLH